MGSGSSQARTCWLGQAWRGAGPGGRQHAGDLARSVESRSSQVMAESQGGRDRGFLRGKDCRCEAGRQAPLLLTPREMSRGTVRTPGACPAAASGHEVRPAKMVPSAVFVLLMLGHLLWGKPTKGRSGDISGEVGQCWRMCLGPSGGGCAGREGIRAREGSPARGRFLRAKLLNRVCQFPAVALGGAISHPNPGLPLGQGCL